MICFVWSNCHSHFPLNTWLWDNDPLLLLDLFHTCLTCCDLLQHKQHLPQRPVFVDQMWVPWEHRNVAHRPVLHPAGHGRAADHSVRHPGDQRLPGMHLWRLPRKKRRKEPTTVTPQSHRTVLEIRNSDCTHRLEPPSWLALWKRYWSYDEVLLWFHFLMSHVLKREFI